MKQWQHVPLVDVRLHLRSQYFCRACSREHSVQVVNRICMEFYSAGTVAPMLLFWVVSVLSMDIRGVVLIIFAIIITSLNSSKVAALLMSLLLYCSFIHSGYFYSTSSSPLLLRGALDYSIDTVPELTRQSATGNCEWRTYPMSLRGSWSGIRTCDPLDARHLTYHWSTTEMAEPSA